MADLFLWRRLDVPGHDACRLEEDARGWTLSGTATFLHEGQPAQLAYQVACDREWRAREGRVRGWVGARAVEVRIGRSPQGGWTLDGGPVPGALGACVDLDFGFTPATNLFQLRRLQLPVGRAADVPVAWFDAGAGTLSVLPQRYQRRSGSTYWYEAPRFEYAALLEVTAAGFVSRYPELWIEETGPGTS
jgi:uncharacterized protein